MDWIIKQFEFAKSNLVRKVRKMVEWDTLDKEVIEDRLVLCLCSNCGVEFVKRKSQIEEERKFDDSLSMTAILKRTKGKTKYIDNLCREELDNLRDQIMRGLFLCVCNTCKKEVEK